MARQRYIKPSVLQLDYSTDEEVVSMSSCKSNTSSNAQTLGGNQGESCSTSACSSITPS